MAAISSCPICAKQVSVPQGADPQTTVRCPLCDAEYTLQAALDLAPPMLVVVGGAAGPGFDDEADTLPMHGSELIDEFGEGDDAALVESSLEESVPFGEVPSFDAPPVEDVDREEIDTELETAKANASPTDELEPTVTALDDFDPDSPFGPPTDDDLMFQSAEGEAGEAGDIDDSNSAAAIAVATRKVKRAKEPSMIGNLIGVVGGGVIGCGMALMIVLWIGGPAYDFMELGTKLPKWMLPSAFSKPKVAANPLSNKPTAADLNEVKKAADDGGFGRIKVNVPTLPDKPAPPAPAAEAAAKEEPAAAEANSVPEDPSALANDLASGDSPIPPAPAPKNSESAAEEPAAEDPAAEAPAEEETAEEEEGTAGSEVEAASANESIGPKQPLAYTAAELQTALDEAQQLAAQLGAADPADVAAAKKIKKDYYLKLFRLGEISTFAKGDDAVEKQAASAAMLAEMSADPEKVIAIGNYATQWLARDAAKRGENQGVLLAGTVEELGEVGGLHRTRLRMTEGGSPVSVYSIAPPEVAVGDTALMLGSIIASPKEAIHNFAGDEATIVWLGTAVKASGQ